MTGNIQEILDTLPQRTYYRIGEVCRVTGVKAHVLRHWEQEFPLKPRKSSSGQRLYRRKDIELALRIKDLLTRRKYTVAGARRALFRPDLEEEPEQPAPTPQADLLRQAVLSLRSELRKLRKELSEMD